MATLSTSSLTAAALAESNPVLPRLTIQFESDTGRAKVGNSLHRWNDLPYLADDSGGGAVDSVNGQTGTVVLDAEDVEAVPTAAGVVVVDAGDDLSTARPTAAVVYWAFDDDAVDVGEAGANIVNALPADLWFVPDA